MDIAQTKALMEQFAIRPTRSLGQNFLVDDRVVQRICQAADIQPTDLVIEIGPGIGHLTTALASRAGQVIAIEIDRHVLPALQAVMADHPNFELVHADALTVALNEKTANWSGPVKIVANLPYYITTPLIMKMVREIPRFATLVLMVQKEAAERLMAAPGQKQYGPAGVLLRCLGTLRREMIVPAGAFWPRPPVDSAVIQVWREPDALAPADWPSFAGFVEACFSLRRKTLLNSLRSYGNAQTREAWSAAIVSCLVRLGLSDRIRAEAIAPAQFVEIWHAIPPQT